MYFIYLLFDIFTWIIRRRDTKNAISGARETLNTIKDDATTKKNHKKLTVVNIYETATNSIEIYYIGPLLKFEWVG
jgi:hypothetical protein